MTSKLNERVQALPTNLPLMLFREDRLINLVGLLGGRVASESICISSYMSIGRAGRTLYKFGD